MNKGSNIKNIEKLVNSKSLTNDFLFELEVNKSKTPSFIPDTFDKFGLPHNTIKIIRDIIGDTQDLSKLKDDFLTPSLIEIKKKQDFLKNYEKVISSKKKPIGYHQKGKITRKRVILENSTFFDELRSLLRKNRFGLKKGGIPITLIKDHFGVGKYDIDKMDEKWKTKFYKLVEDELYNQHKRDSFRFIDQYKISKNILETEKITGIYYSKLKSLNLIDDIQIKKIREKIDKIQLNDWFEKSKKRCLDLMKRGFNYNHSIDLSGLQISGSGVMGWGYKHSISTDTKFEKKFMEYKSTIPGVYNPSRNKDEEYLKKDKNYLQKLIEFKEDFEKENKQFLDQFKNRNIMWNSRLFPPTSINTGWVIPPYELYLRRVITRVISGQVKRVRSGESQLRKREKKNKKILKYLPKEWREITHGVSKEGRILYGVNGDMISKKCSCCKEYHPIRSYTIQTNTKVKSLDGKPKNMCDKCRVMRWRKLKGLPQGTGRKGEIYKGRIIRKYNNLGEVVERRCNSCDDFKSIKKFHNLWKKSSVCEDCYVQIPNNKLTRKGEFYRGVRVRVYNEKTFILEKKRCSTCKEILDVSEFNITRNKVSTDGLLWYCRKCTSKMYQKKKRRTNPSR